VNILQFGRRARVDRQKYPRTLYRERERERERESRGVGMELREYPSRVILAS